MEANLKKTGCQEITAEFLDSAKQLDLGELLHSSHFTLLEAMSAIELMDAKMDSGIVLRKVNRRILSLEEAVKAGTVKINNLTPEELLGIIDDTYSCLSTWLEGHPLWANVMTNLYLHEPDMIEDQTLKVFSQSILKIVGSIDKLVYQICCIEEEDFVLNLGKFKLAPSLSDHKALTNLDSLCQQYEKTLAERSKTQVTASTPTRTKQNTSNNHLPNDLSLQNLSKQHLSALISRLRFTYHFYSCFFNINRCLPKNFQNESTTSAMEQLKAVKLVQQSAKDCDQQLEKSLRYLNEWEQTIGLGIKPSKPSYQEETSVVNDDYPTITGFDPLINLPFINWAYPRSPCIKNRQTALVDLKRLINRIRECIQLSKSFDKVSLIESLDSVEYLSKYTKLGSCVVSRSFVQALYTPDRYVIQLQDKLLQSLNDFCEPLVQMMKRSPEKQTALDNFLSECAKSFAQVINLYGHNTSRQHERLAETIASFKNLQYSAVMINAEFNNVIIYSWTTYHLARFCIKYIMAGIELELFSSHEFPYVYWYLYDILYRSEKEQLEMAKQFFIDQTTLEENQKKSKLNEQRRKILESTIYHDKCLIHNRAFRFLSAGTFLLTHGLKLQNKIKSPLLNDSVVDENNKSIEETEVNKQPPTNNYTSLEVCFNRRFRSLMGTGVYQCYAQMIMRLNNLEYIYSEALDCFMEAKKLFETFDNANFDNCLKVCKKNMVVSRILANDLNSFNDREIDFSFETHPSFPTLKV